MYVLCVLLQEINLENKLTNFLTLCTLFKSFSLQTILLFFLTILYKSLLKFNEKTFGAFPLAISCFCLYQRVQIVTFKFGELRNLRDLVVGMAEWYDAGGEGRAVLNVCKNFYFCLILYLERDLFQNGFLLRFILFSLQIRFIRRVIRL